METSLPVTLPAKSCGSMLTRGLALLAAYRTGEQDHSQIELARRTGLPDRPVLVGLREVDGAVAAGAGRCGGRC